MFRAALELFRHWELSDEAAATLLDLPLRTFRRWKAGEVGRIDRDGKARLSNIMGIHKALRIIFSEPTPGLCLDQGTQRSLRQSKRARRDAGRRAD